MKYMHLNSSCPYAGLANMLQLLGHDTEDFQIALDIDLPSHIRYDGEDGAFRSGFSLQSKEWFDLYLNPRGLTYTEHFWNREQAAARLLPGMMLGIFITPEQKHAVVCSGRDAGCITFINNKREQTDEPETFSFAPAQLLERLPERVAVGRVEPAAPTAVDLRPIYQESLHTWELLRAKLHAFMGETQPAEALRGQLNTLFRPLLLDGLTMAQLCGDEPLTGQLTILQTAFLQILRQNSPARLSDHVDMALLDASIHRIIRHAEDKMNHLP